MDGEAGLWTTSRNIGLPPLARAMGVGRQQQETTKIRIDQCLAKCTGELIRMVYVSNNKPMPNIEVSSVLEIHRQLIIDSFQIGTIGSVSAEEMILNFMLNMDLFSYK